MAKSDIAPLYDQLKSSLAELIQKEGLAGGELEVRCRVLESAEAIGNPKDQDYPILRGREHMVEATFAGARGQAFADEFENLTGPVETLAGKWTSKPTPSVRSLLPGSTPFIVHCGRCEENGPLQG